MLQLQSVAEVIFIEPHTRLNFLVLKFDIVSKLEAVWICLENVPSKYYSLNARIFVCFCLCLLNLECRKSATLLLIKKILPYCTLQTF